MTLIDCMQSINSRTLATPYTACASSETVAGSGGCSFGLLDRVGVTVRWNGSTEDAAADNDITSQRQDASLGNERARMPF
jgi:hypothetical protein